MGRFFRSLGIVATATAVLVVGTWTNVLPWYPRSMMSWVMFVVVGVPALLVAEVFWEWLISGNAVSRWVEHRTAGSRFSWMRVSHHLSVVVAVVALFFGGVGFVAKLLGR
ncbi:MAG TPA: hypothetical protein VGM84_26750 [Steroidobacteraceae bacterium]|jgi:hypothetical protein